MQYLDKQTNNIRYRTRKKIALKSIATFFIIAIYIQQRKTPRNIASS